jgi:hypothetical protein
VMNGLSRSFFHDRSILPARTIIARSRGGVPRVSSLGGIGTFSRTVERIRSRNPIQIVHSGEESVESRFTRNGRDKKA